MSRLDQHVAAVQNKLALDRFFVGLSRAALVFIGAVWIAVVVDRMFALRLPQWQWWVYGGLGATALAGVIYAIARRPDQFAAATRIDEVLNTKDKFATALHVRQMSDPFAHAALLDAERTAENVSLSKRFPLHFPRAAFFVPVGALIVLATMAWLAPMDLFGHQAKQRKQAQQLVKAEQGQKALKDALAAVSQVPKSMEKNDAITLAKESLMQQLNQPVTDPARAQRTAAKALEDVNEAIKNEIKKNQKFAEAENEAKMFRQLQQNPPDDNGPISKVQTEMAKGNFTEAIDELNKTVENFDKMKDEDKAKAAQQMKNLANQLQQMANNPQQQQQMQQQLQQMGANQQQAQQMQQLMQKAAQGDQQAQKQLQQMAQQMMKQMNNGQGPNPQQQQQIQQAIQQMQAQQNAQQNAQQMQQAAQQMAQAMQQAAQKQNGQQGQNAQQGKNQQQAQQQGGKQQQMAQAKQQMQQQMQQMQAMQGDMQQIGAAQQAAQNAAQQAMAGMNGKGGNPGQNGQGDWQGNGPMQGGDQDQPWGGQQNNGMGPNPGGKGAGDRHEKEQAPYGIKPEMDPSKDNDKGRVLAATLVKDHAPKGESKEQLKEITEAAVKNATDEVEQDRISRQSQSVVKEYFGSIQKDVESAPAPTTAPSK